MGLFCRKGSKILEFHMSRAKVSKIWRKMSKFSQKKVAANFRKNNLLPRLVFRKNSWQLKPVFNNLKILTGCPGVSLVIIRKNLSKYLELIVDFLNKILKEFI